MATAVNYIETNPCVQCFFGKELDALLVLLLAEKAGYTLPDDLSTLVDDTVCLKCWSETQLKQSIASFLWTQQDNGETSAELMAKIKCLLCADPQTIKALHTHLLTLALTT